MEPVCIHVKEANELWDVDMCRFQGIRCSPDVCPVYTSFDWWFFGRGGFCRGDAIPEDVAEVRGVKCPHCGSRGKKKSHRRFLLEENAKEYGWYDLRCGSCGSVFRGYDWR